MSGWLLHSLSPSWCTGGEQLDKGVDLPARVHAARRKHGERVEREHVERSGKGVPVLGPPDRAERTRVQRHHLEVHDNNLERLEKGPAKKAKKAAGPIPAFIYSNVCLYMPTMSPNTTGEFKWTI